NRALHRRLLAGHLQRRTRPVASAAAGPRPGREPAGSAARAIARIAPAPPHPPGSPRFAVSAPLARHPRRRRNAHPHDPVPTPRTIHLLRELIRSSLVLLPDDTKESEFALPRGDCPALPAVHHAGDLLVGKICQLPHRDVP